MTNINEILKICQGIVMNCNHSVLIIKLFGEVRVFLFTNMTLKNRDFPYNEIRDAQDITDVLNNISFIAAQGWNERVLMDRVQSIPKQDFKFGTDDFMWLTNVEMNKG